MAGGKAAAWRGALRDGGGSTRLFVVAGGATLTLRHLALRGGRSLLSGGGAVGQVGLESPACMPMCHL